MTTSKDKTATQRNARLRERRKNMGMNRHEIWCYDNDWEEIKAFISKKNALQNTTKK